LHKPEITPLGISTTSATGPIDGLAHDFKSFSNAIVEAGSILQLCVREDAIE
jgi:hypothetical protein